MDNERGGVCLRTLQRYGGYFAFWQRRGGMQKHAMRPAEVEYGRWKMQVKGGRWRPT